jgi:hypothetical protein
MSGWIRRFITRAKNFDMFRSVWFSNLDCMVDNIRYLQDDGDERKQCSKSSESGKSVESKQCDQPSHHCANHSTRTCNCTGHDCIDNDSDGNTSYFGSNRKERIKWNDVCTKPRYKYYDDAGYRESSRGAEG